MTDTKLSPLERLKIKRDSLKAKLNHKNPLMDSFYGGRVGFKSGSAKRKWEKSIDKELDLMKELSDVESKIERLENPVKKSKAVEIAPSVFNVGDIAFEPFGNKVTILKINAKTVTIQYGGGFKETIKPHLLTK